MKLVLTHPTSNEFVKAAAYGFHQANLLSHFYTSIACFPGTILDAVGRHPLLSEIHRRRFNASIRSFTQTHPWKEILRHLSLKAKLSSLTTHEVGIFSIDAVYRSLDKHVAYKIKNNLLDQINAVYAYEDGALLSFIEAKRQNHICLYDLPIGYWRTSQRLLQSERERWPNWASTLTGFKDSASKLARKDEELSLADTIFVASKFTADTLQDYPGHLAPIEIIPYAFPPVADSAFPKSKNLQNQPLKLLFVGSLSQRKGIADLFAAVNKIGHYVELTVVGHKVSDNCPALDEELNKHTWIPSLCHQGILKLMRAHDVLVFPSLFEGFGLVITEAMSQGVPVITTERTAGPDLIRDGENGWLIKAGSTEALISAIDNLLHHPKLVTDTGRAAMETARHRPWQVYGHDLSVAVEKIMNSKRS